MVALTESRLTPKRDGARFSRPVAAGATIFGGAIVALTAAGLATPGATAVGLTVDGIAKADADNSSGAAGDIAVEVEKGVFRFANSAGADEITAAEIGDTAYLVDDQTVAKTDGAASRSTAGKIVDVDAQGVWIDLT
ncbi:MAG: hypothetical protein COW16_10435 [Sphingomonadales bacterium CG12_big_fil_rev_8_21_14_0_65_65_10]|nr:MAG: hypothetical protein COW16_10435 [Sphingomonadales bacterium CG12_big_fil_rev_8_21_14_0_65_65_10]